MNKLHLKNLPLFHSYFLVYCLCVYACVSVFMHNSVCVFVSHILYILCLRLYQSIHIAMFMSVFARIHKNKGYGELGQ